MNIKSQKIIIVFLIILLCITQITFPYTLYPNSKLLKLHKFNDIEIYKTYMSKNKVMCTSDLESNSVVKTNIKKDVENEIKTRLIIKNELVINKNEKEDNIELISDEDNRAIIQNDVWNIEIPKISLVAPIKDGTDKENLNMYVGHFYESGYESGNICLAAHNRGYKVNYFKDIKLLQSGDEIIYKYKNFTKKFIVVNSRIIKDTDVEVIENTKEDKITLITCVENEPSKRRCVEGKLKLERSL